MVTRACDGTAWAREIAHTADVGFEVEAPTLPVLFERAGLALTTLLVDPVTIVPRASITVAVDAAGHAELLHDWLQALLVRQQVDGFVASELSVEHVDDAHLRAVVTGEPFDPARHRAREEVKGVTYHQLAVCAVPTGWTARVILDV